MNTKAANDCVQISGKNTPAQDSLAPTPDQNQAKTTLLDKPHHQNQTSPLCKGSVSFLCLFTEKGWLSLTLTRIGLSSGTEILVKSGA